MQSFFDSVVNWPFLNEPIYRWAIFVMAMAFISWGWSGVLGLMH